MRKRRYGLILAAALIFSVIFGAEPAFSAVRIDVGREGSISLDYGYNGTKLADVEFSIYRAADISEDGGLTLSGDFKDYSVIIEDLDSSGWKAAAFTLASYVGSDHLPAIMSVKTNEQGQIDFGVFKTGLYLIIGEDKKAGELTYKADPFLISLPGLDADDTWNYNVSVKPKCTVKDEPLESKRTVLKVWNDGGNKTYRPESIQVSLLRNGAVYETVTLDASNYWRHAWSGLNPEDTWGIVEQNIPDHYTVTYSQEGAILTVSNSIRKTGGGGGGGGTTRKYGKAENLEKITDTDVPAGLPSIPEEEIPLAGWLPQTGLLRWPIPVLGAAGLVLFALGWREYIGKRKEKDAS